MKMSDRGPESVSATDIEMVKAHAKEKGNNCKKKNRLYILGLSSEVAT